jgi:hypothetical protein
VALAVRLAVALAGGTVALARVRLDHFILSPQIFTGAQG